MPGYRSCKNDELPTPEGCITAHIMCVRVFEEDRRAGFLSVST